MSRVGAGRPRHMRFTPTHKHCIRCNRWLPHSEFGLDRSRPSGLESSCRSCAVSKKRVWRETNRTSHTVSNRKSYRIKTYGLSDDDYYAMLLEQDGLCAICREEPSFRRQPLHIDHNHDTGKVRALLCGHCNQAIGKFREDPHVLRRAADYLERYA